MENRDRISNITCCKKSDQTWMKWMDFGQRMGCHQKPDRSFFIGGYQLPVCARCTGVFIGYLATLFLLPATKGKEKITNIVAAAGCITMLTDWSLQALKIKESTNKRRFLTGIIGGLGIMTLWIHLISKFLRAILKKQQKMWPKKCNIARTLPSVAVKNHESIRKAAEKLLIFCSQQR